MYAMFAPRMFGPYIAPVGGADIAASSLVTPSGMLNIVQCRIGALFLIASGSCMMITYDLVPLGPALHDRPGNTFPLYCVFSNGISAPAAKAGDETVSFAFPLAGRVTSASMAAPGSAPAGACCASSVD